MLATCTKDGVASLNPMSFTDQHSNTIMERLRYQRASGRFCDALIIVKDRKFNAHRMLLAAASPYFDAILRYNKIVKEKIIVNSNNPAVFEVLLNYIYSGTIVIDRNIVTELLKLANNLLIVRLKNYCADYLERYIDVANCLSVHDLALRYNLPDLSKKASEFFDSNINGCLLENVDLLNYNVQQLTDLLKNPKYYEIIRSDVHLNFIVRWVGHNLEERENLFQRLLKECPFQQVSTMRLERMLDYNPFFAHSEISLYVILHEMHNVGMSMEKYEVQYRNLVKKYSRDERVPLFASKYYMDEPINGSGAFLSGQNTQEDMEDAEVMDFTRKAENLGGISADMDQPIYAHQADIGGTSNALHLQRQIQQEQSDRPSLKLRISLAGISQDQDDPLSGHSAGIQPKRRLLYGLNHYRKKQKLMLRRRGRPPKLPSTRLHDRGDLAEESESSFFDFQDENNENIHLINMFDEADEIDPNNPIEMESDNTAQDELVEQHPEIQCEYCTFRGRTEKQLHNHFASAHLKNILYVCNICQFECKWNRQFYDHMRQHFPGPVFQCDNCPYTADRIHILLSHRLTHTGEKPFKCTDCDFRCRNRSNLVTHYRLHSGERPFACRECTKRFAVRATFEQHVAAHSDERPFVCDECDFTTKYQSHLISHRRIHSGDLFRCEVEGCDYSSPKKSQLAAHLRTHLAVRSHKCRICNRSFIEKSHLIRHERIHLADKPFKCNHCDYASSRRDKLKEHILKHHSGATAAGPSADNSGGTAGPSASATPSTSADALQMYRRRYRRVRQIAQLTAQTKLNPPNPSNFFRPIPHNNALHNQQPGQRQQKEQSQFQAPQSDQQQQQNRQLQHEKQQQQFVVGQRRQRGGSESAVGAIHAQTDQFIGQPQLSQIPAAAEDIATMNLIPQRQQQQQPQSSYSTILTQPQLIGERFQPQVNNEQNQMLGTRPCSASLPQKNPYDEAASLSPSCYSLRDFQLHHHTSHHSHTSMHHLDQAHHHSGGFDETAAPTPDTDLATPGPHPENLRNPHSVSSHFEAAVRSGGSGPGTSGGSSSFAHQLSIDESQLQAVVAAAAAAAAIVGQNDQQPQEQDTLQRPMSLPNYGGLVQQFSMQPQQHLQQFPQQQQQQPTAADLRQQMDRQPAPYYNLMGLNAGQMIMQQAQTQQIHHQGQHQQIQQPQQQPKQQPTGGQSWQ